MAPSKGKPVRLKDPRRAKIAKIFREKFRVTRVTSIREVSPGVFSANCHRDRIGNGKYFFCARHTVAYREGDQMRWRNLACDSESCPGFFVNGETLAAERCDTCQLFKSDGEAALVLEALAKIGLDALMRRPSAGIEAAAALGPFVINMLGKGGHETETPM